MSKSRLPAIAFIVIVTIWTLTSCFTTTKYGCPTGQGRTPGKFTK